MGLIRRHTNPAYATPPEAINFLASACDRAHKRDGWGFGSDHFEVGHYLANTPPVGWQPLDHQTAANLIRIYQQQLAKAGFNPRDLLGQAKPPKLSKRRHKRSQPTKAGSLTPPACGSGDTGTAHAGPTTPSTPTHDHRSHHHMNNPDHG